MIWPIDIRNMVYKDERCPATPSTKVLGPHFIEQDSSIRPSLEDEDFHFDVD